MGSATKIQWTDATWSPVTGCTKVSPGCASCYAERISKRLAGRLGYPADNPFKVTLHPDRLEQPLRWRKSRRVFVCSMGDLFHPDVPDEFIDKVFAVMALCPQHTWQVLTKRVGRAADYLGSVLTPVRITEAYMVVATSASWIVHRVNAAAEFTNSRGRPGFVEPWPLPNVWLGTSVEDQPSADQRVPELLKCPAEVLFVSAEPLLAPIELHLKSLKPTREYEFTQASRARIGWLVVGAETGPGARPMKLEWARSIRDQCRAAGVPFFMKAVSGRQPIPDDLLIREFPKVVHDASIT